MSWTKACYVSPPRSGGDTCPYTGPVLGQLLSLLLRTHRRSRLTLKGTNDLPPSLPPSLACTSEATGACEGRSEGGRQTIRFLHYLYLPLTPVTLGNRGRYLRLLPSRPPSRAPVGEVEVTRGRFLCPPFN
jgi:hypothetical protein